jgi:hypothetical protein
VSRGALDDRKGRIETGEREQCLSAGLVGPGAGSSVT